MKTSLLVAIMVVLALLVGCATQTEEPAPQEEQETPPAQEEQETPPAQEEDPVEQEQEAPAGGDVVFSGSGFDPAEIKISAGSTLKVLVKDEGSVTYSFVIKEIGDRTTRIKDGEVADLKFEEAGEYTVLSIPFSRKLAVTVE